MLTGRVKGKELLGSAGRISRIMMVMLIGGLASFTGGCSSDDSDELWTVCGVVLDGDYVNPPATDDGDEVIVTGAESESRVVIRNEDGEAMLVKLLGVKDVEPEDANPEAVEFLMSFPGKAYFYRAKEDCTITEDGIRLIPGTVVTAAGFSLGEEVMRRGYGIPDDKKQCNSELVNNCYAALAVGAGE